MATPARSAMAAYMSNILTYSELLFQPRHGDLRHIRPDQSKAFLDRFRAWIDAHTDQAIIAGGLILGFWFIAKSIYLIVT